MNANLFAYGTLMCADVMQAVVGTLSVGVPATLRDYQRLAVKGEVYPGLMAHAGCTVSGILYRGLPAAAWTRLDAFEGEMYSREMVQVILADGSSSEAFTYVVKSEYSQTLESREWDLARFMQSGKAEFAKRYLGFGRVGRGSDELRASE